MKIGGTLIGRKLIIMALWALWLLTAATHGAKADCQGDTAAGSVDIERLHFQGGQGEGYRMIYCVAVPIEIYWRFKTDFNNDFLTGNPHILTHRFVRREGQVVQTENRYTHNQKRLFRWQTTVDADEYRMDFKLLNPEEAGQKFHFGTIRLEDRGRRTAVYQEARFQFAGAALWAFYPWRGGMRSFLQSFAAWEQQAARSWQSRYEAALRREKQTQANLRQLFPGNSRYPDR